MPRLTGFAAYPSDPPVIGNVIKLALEGLRVENADITISTWEENDIAGRFVVDPILSQIDSGDILLADITRLNFNVIFEIGYGIGRRKRVFVVRNSAIKGSEDLIKEIGIFDTLGCGLYSHSGELIQTIKSIKDTEPLVFNAKEVNRFAPVYLILPRVKTDAEIRLLSRIKKSRLNFRSFDPEEQGRLPAGDAIDNVAESLGVVSILLGRNRLGADVHNFRAAFAAGLALALDKALYLLQDGEDPVPLDYRDLVKIFRFPQQIDEHIAAFATEVTARLQAISPPVVSAPKSLLERINLGASSAENELQELGHYYLETDEFGRALRGEVQVVTGRKGVGKTALFAQVRDRLRRDRRRIVLDLKPEGFQLLKFKERVLDYLQRGAREHTITAFWEYLLLLETCYKILQKDETPHMRDNRLYEPYRRLALLYFEDDFVSEGDFAERMLKLTQRIADDFEASGTEQNGREGLTSGQITELLYKHDVAALRDHVVDYLTLKEGLWILFDNLDKGWPPYGVTEDDVSTLRCLLDAMAKIERDLTRRGIDCHCIVFIRNDVYELLVATSPDRGKISQVDLDWTDPDLLRQLLRRRFLYTTGMKGDPEFDDIWRQICITHIRGEETSQYLIERCLMRPRGLIDLIRFCRSHAVNLGHDKIELEDIEEGEAAFSSDLLTNVGFELRDVFPAGGEILYEFIEEPARLMGVRLREILVGAVGEDTWERLLELLLWYGVLGIVRGDGEINYIYSVKYDVKRLTTLARKRGVDDTLFAINPAFWKAIEVC